MGTRTSNPATQTVAKISKTPKCSICRQIITDTCTWRQGRCPHVPSMASQIINNPYKARFYNLIKFFKGNKK